MSSRSLLYNSDESSFSSKLFSIFWFIRWRVVWANLRDNWWWWPSFSSLMGCKLLVSNLENIEPSFYVPPNCTSLNPLYELSSIELSSGILFWLFGDTLLLGLDIKLLIEWVLYLRRRSRLTLGVIAPGETPAWFTFSNLRGSIIDTLLSFYFEEFIDPFMLVKFWGVGLVGLRLSEGDSSVLNFKLFLPPFKFFILFRIFGFLLFLPLSIILS